jgi:hypothetical protein
MLSSTDNHPNVCTRWNVRRSPRRARHNDDRLVNVGAVEADPALVGARTPETTSKTRRLPGAVGPDDPEHLARRGVEAHVAQGDDPTEADADAVELIIGAVDPDGGGRSSASSPTCSALVTTHSPGLERPAAS